MTSITLDVLVKFDSFGPTVTREPLISKIEGSNEKGYMIRAGGNGKIDFTLGDGVNGWTGIETGEGVIQLNVWHHIAGTYDGTYLKHLSKALC